MRYIRKSRGNVLCTVYYEPIMDGRYYVIEFPAERRVYFAKRGKLKQTVQELCDKLFDKFPLERGHMDTTPTRMRALDYARTVVHYVSTSNMDDEVAQVMLQEGIVTTLLLPLLDECVCSPRTKEFFLVLLDKYLRNEIDQRELVKSVMRRSIRLTKGLKLYTVKFY